ncbi:MAG: hypothetical protein ACOYD4_04160 [Solirubrobacterales bacterium]
MKTPHQFNAREFHTRRAAASVLTGRHWRPIACGQGLETYASPTDPAGRVSILPPSHPGGTWSLLQWTETPRLMKPRRSHPAAVEMANAKRDLNNARRLAYSTRFTADHPRALEILAAAKDVHHRAQTRWLRAFRIENR